MSINGDLDQYVSQGVGVSAHTVELFIRDACGLVSEEFATPHERNRFEPRIRTIDELHGALHERKSRDFVLCWVARSSAPASQANALEISRADVGGVPTSIR